LKASELKQLLEERLVDKFNGRELTSVISYYIDATRKVLPWDETQVLKDIDLLLDDVPVQYVTKTSFFFGHKFLVDSSVLIPRPETEELVDWILTEEKGIGKSVLDIGTGSGCILLSILSKLPESKGVGVDISDAAIEVFKINGQRLELEAETEIADILYDDLADRFAAADIIVSNPPYILESEKDRMGESVLKYEPEVALFVPYDDPLVFYKRIINLVMKHSSKGARIYFETSDLYQLELEVFVQKTGLEYEFRKDLSGNQRMLRIEI